METPRVVVVGSGPAGMTAAFTLLSAGYLPSEILVLERRPSVAARFNVVQLAALSLARLDTFKASEAADAESVLKSMMDGGVLGKVGNFHSRIEARTGKPTSERSKDLDLASPCGRIIELKIDIAGREWEGGKWAKQLKGDQKFKEVQESLFGAPYAVYICDIERHMHRIAGLRGIPVAFACDTELVYDEKADRYELFVTRHEAKLDGNETTQHVDRLPPLESRVSLGTPELIVVAEGGGRAMMKSQGILERHGIEIQLKSVTKLFASALTRHPTPSELVNQSSVLGETHYFATPGQFPESVSIVSGNVITRAPKYLAMEKEGKEVPPDTWYIRLPPNDDLQLERLSFSVNPQDFGITEYAPSAAMTNYVTTRVGRMLGHLSSPEIAAKAEIIKIARPFPQTDTVLSSCAFANVAIFGDAARTGSFLSGMGMNSLMCLNSNSLLAIAKTARDGKLSAAAREEYTASIQKATKEWHKMTRVIQTEALPPWIPDLEVTSAAESKKEAPRTLLKFGKIETLGRYAIANLILNYLVPIKFLRVGLRRVGEWVVGGVERRDEARASL